MQAESSVLVMLTFVVTQRACRFVTKAEQKMSAFTSVQSHSWEKKKIEHIREKEHFLLLVIHS